MLVGMPSVFVRTSGCNLRCWFCDTPYTSWKPEGEQQSVDSIIAQLKSVATHHVVITGGEPLITPEVEELCSAIRSLGRHITIETAATIYKPVAADLISLSPKLANSTPPADSGWAQRHEHDRINIPVIRRFLQNYDCQLKFVMDNPEDIHEVQRVVAELPTVKLQQVFLMPQAIDAATLVEKGRWIAELCKAHGYRLGARLHIELWGHQRGK